MLSPDLNWRFAPRWRHDCIRGIFAEVGKLNDVRVTKLGANQKGVFWVLAACRPRVRQIKFERQRVRTYSRSQGCDFKFQIQFRRGRTCQGELEFEGKADCGPRDYWSNCRWLSSCLRCGELTEQLPAAE